MGKKQKKPKKLTKKEQEIVRTLLLDNTSQYATKIKEHIEKEADKNNLGEYKVEKITPEQFYKQMKENREEMADYVRNFGFITTTGSKKYRKYDAEIHKFIAENADPEAVVLGVCHGAQQYAVAHEAKLKKTENMQQGKRKSKVRKKYHGHDVLKEVPIEKGEMEHYGHHKWYIPSEDVGDNLEIIAEAEFKNGEKFVEMYKVKEKDHFGIQAHPEKGNGEIIRNLFKQALKKKGYLVEDKYLEERYARV